MSVRRLTPDNADARFIRRLIIAIMLGLLLVALYRASNILILAFGSVLGAVAIRALGRLFERRLHLPHKAAIVAGMAAALAVIVLLVWLFTAQFGRQIGQLITSLPEIIGSLKAMLAQSPVGAKIADAVESAYAGSRVANDISGIVLGSGEVLLNALLVVVGAFFLAADPTAYERGLLLLVPRSKRRAFEEAFEETEARLRLWLRAQIIQMTTMGLLVYAGLVIAGVPSAGALALLVGLSEFIPYVGPIVAMLPAIGLAATQDSGTVIGTLATFAGARIIQTNLITPFVQNRVVFIPPAITLFAIIGIGAITGIYGLFFSAAMLVVVFSLVQNLYLRDVLGEDVGEHLAGKPVAEGADERVPREE